MRNLIMLAMLVCGLVFTPNYGFTQDVQWADAYMTPDTGSLLNGFGGFVGGEIPYQYDWTIGNRVPYPDTDPTTDAIVFSTWVGPNYNDWEERMRIRKDGNVGIGTTTPWRKLTVIGDLQVATLPGSIGFSQSADGSFDVDSPSVNGGRFRILENGNVGIGTPNPQNKLDIAGVLKVRTIDETGNSIFIEDEARDNAFGLQMIYNQIRANTYINGNGDGTGYQWSGHYGLVIDLINGNVGIDTPSPNSKLQVTDGDVYVETIGSGVILRSPDGSCFRVTVNNDGTFASASVTCP